MGKALFMLLPFWLTVMSACETLPNLSTLPKTFTTEAILKVNQGMTSDEIMRLFGPPKSVGQAVCGGAKPWTCTTWEYGEFPYDRATFTFSGKRDEKILNDFKIDRK